MAYKRAKRPQPRSLLTGYCQSCGKIRYMTKADARKAADRIMKRMRPYRCPHGGPFWHLASWQPPGRVAYYREKNASAQGKTPQA